MPPTYGGIFCKKEHIKVMDILKESKEMQAELTAWRRYLHAHAETGFALNETTAFIKAELVKMGYEPQTCGRAGVVAEVGAGEIFLLRADMDALPIPEKSGEKFACKSGNMHACGHDMHATMLLGAAKILKAHESELKRKVRLLFQPAEETLEGSKDCVEAGVLQGVKGAMMIHSMTNVPIPVGCAVVSSPGVSAPAADFFSIEVKGKSCHGSAPWNGVDALTAAANILLALQEIPARELNPGGAAVLTIGEMKGGTASNVIADSAILKGTLRAYDEELRSLIKERLEEIAAAVAKAYRARAKVTYESGCPTLVNDETLSEQMERVGKELLGERCVFTSKALQGDAKAKSGGSEDFAYISQRVPSIMVALAAGEPSKGYEYPLHHAKVMFDENALPVGAALYAAVALKI